MSLKVVPDGEFNIKIIVSEKSKYYCDKCQIEPIGAHVHCPKCDSSPGDHEVKNYDSMWRDGDVYCTKCKTYVRRYDAG